MPKRPLLIVAVLLLAVTAVLYFKEPTSPKTVSACDTSDFSGIFDKGAKLGFFDGKFVKPIDTLANAPPDTQVLSAVSGEEKWIEVDLSDQKLRAWNGNELFLETLVSTGLPGTPTPTGEFRIWIKLRATKMEGGVGRNYYYLPNVPYVMFFESDELPGYLGYGLHGTYWHSDFGTQKSHGCVNLPTPIAEQLYYWTNPYLAGKSAVKSNESNLGTRIIIHE